MNRVCKVAALAAGVGAMALGVTGQAIADGSHGASAQGAAVASPGVISGNVIQVPVNVPLQLCGDTLDVVALLNPSSGNTCVTG